MFLDNPNKEEVVQIMGENEHIRKAIDELEQVSGDEKLRRIAELREKAIRDEQAAMAYAKEHGYNEGYEEGERKGKIAGKIAGRIEIAKKLLKKGMKIEEIEEITGMSIEEIKQLK